MFNWTKKDKVDGATVVMSKHMPAPSTRTVLPLTLENLPWDQDRIPEEEEYVKKYVINKRYPSWYRPRSVRLNKNSFMTIKRYLQDQETQKQYTVGEMEGMLGLQRSGYQPQEGIKTWLLDVFHNTTVMRLKVPKPFELDYNQLIPAIQPTSNALCNIAGILRLKKTGERQAQEPPLSLIYATPVARNDTENDNSSETECLRNLYKAYVDMLMVQGVYENCFIHLMRHGDEEEWDECMKVKSKELGIHVYGNRPGKEPLMARDMKCLTFWERLQKSKINQKLLLERYRNQSVFYRGLQSQAAPAVEMEKIEHCQDYTDTSRDERNINTDTVDDGQTIPTEINGDDKNTKTREKNGKKRVLRKLTAPFRWLKKKF